MGRIKIILKKDKVPLPQLNNRFTCELCENIHIHYRNMRIEFTKEEFLHVLRLLQGIDIQEVENFKYSDWAYKELITDFELPEETFYNDRLQIEQQMEGHYHIHYRNVRLEFDDLQYIGFSKYFGWYKKCKYYLQQKFHQTVMFIIRHTHTIKKILELEKLNIKFDKGFLSRITKNRFYTYRIKMMEIKDLKCMLLTKDGWHRYKLKDAPEYKFLSGNRQAYIDYCDYKNPRADGEIHSISRYNELLDSLEKKGYDNNYCIIINQNNEIIDGKHRACWLLNKYGKHCKVKVLKIYMETDADRRNKYKNFISTKRHRIKNDVLSDIPEYNLIHFNCIQPQDTICQLYYTENIYEVFSEDKSINGDMPKTKNKIKDVFIGIYAEQISMLRIDAGKPGDVITISDLTIQNQDQTTKLDFTKFEPANMDVLEQTTDYITFKPTTDDPQLVYKL